MHPNVFKESVDDNLDIELQFENTYKGVLKFKTLVGILFMR
jgi:hypothetical protein